MAFSNRYINALVDYVKTHDDWQTSLKKAPYNLKSVKQCPWNPNWFMFVYNLFSSELTNDVVRGCRGTVLEVNGEDVKVICAPYTKFFGYGDPSGKDIEDSINWQNAQVQLKVDGIIIKTAKYGDRLYFFTNGSFELNAPFEDSFVFDEEATRGMRYYGDLLKYALEQRIHDDVCFDEETGQFYCCGKFADVFKEGSTLMFELVSPRNRIICKYNETKLWLHGYRDENGLEHNPAHLPFRWDEEARIFEVPRTFNLNTKDFSSVMELVKEFDGSKMEGVVVVDYTTEGTPRSKIKCEDYLKLKFAMDTANNTSVLFRAVVMDEYDDIVASAPATLPKVEEIKGSISKFMDWCLAEEKTLPEFGTKKEYVEYIRENKNPKLFSLYMDMWHEHNVEQRLRGRLMNLSTKKHGYDDLLALSEEF